MARSALFISSSAYSDDQLTHLPSAAADAEELGRVLANPEIGGFAVSTLHDPAAQQLREAVEEFLAEAESEDLLVLYLSGHGLKNPRGSLFFAAHDTRPNRLQSTAVSAFFLCSLLNESRAGGIVVFLDCCYGGAFAQGMVPRAAGDPQVGDAFATLGQGARARAVVTASSAIEYAFESERLAESHAEPSVFASAMRDGIQRGEADRDGDGWVGLSELFDYVTQRIAALGKPQTPHLWTFGLSGDLRLTRSPRGPTSSSSALPAEIRELLKSPLPAVRLGAVAELEQRARGSDLDGARAAVAALGELAEDDSLRVRAAVGMALAGLTPKVEPPSLEVRLPEAGRASVSARLSGPAIAFDAYVEPVAEGVTADVVGDEITVKVGPSAPSGELRLNLRWTGGTVPIALTVAPASVGTSPAEPTPGESAIVELSPAESAPVEHASETPSLVERPLSPDSQSFRPGSGGQPPAPDKLWWLVAAGACVALSQFIPFDSSSASDSNFTDVPVLAFLLLGIGLTPAWLAMSQRQGRRRGRRWHIVAIVIAALLAAYVTLGIAAIIAGDLEDTIAVVLILAAVCLAVYLIGVIRRARAGAEARGTGA